MLTVGVDLAAQEEATWMATIEWSPGRARLVDLRGHVSDADIVEAALTADVVSIDCPFGWPETFYEFIGRHRAGGLAAQKLAFSDWSRSVAFRMTDLEIQRQTKIWPLSVMSNLLGRTALRCAVLLADIAAAGVCVDRSGTTGTVAEVYPAASLRVWEREYKQYSGYKGNKAKLKDILDDLLLQAEWLGVSDRHRNDCATTHDAMDAVVASLTARAAAVGQASKPAPEQLEMARIEGWICLPNTGSLPGLIGTK